MYISYIMYKVPKHLLNHFLFMDYSSFDFYSIFPEHFLRIDGFYITSNYVLLNKFPEIKLYICKRIIKFYFSFNFK